MAGKIHINFKWKFNLKKEGIYAKEIGLIDQTTLNKHHKLLVFLSLCYLMAMTSLFMGLSFNDRVGIITSNSRSAWRRMGMMIGAVTLGMAADKFETSLYVVLF